MKKQIKVLVNPKGKTISEVLGVTDKKVSDKIIESARDAYHSKEKITESINVLHKSAKTQEEFLWGLFSLGIERGVHIERNDASKKTALDLTFKLLGGGSSNASFWGALDALVVMLLLVGLTGTILSFPKNWFLIPLDLVVLGIIFWRRVK